VSAVRPELDPKAPANVADPFPLYCWLRERDPVHWSESLRAWMVTRYADVIEIFNRPEDFSSDRFRRLDARFASRRKEVLAVSEVLSDWLVFRDPPDHTRLRALLQKSFSPRQLEKSRAGIQSTVDRLLDAVADDGRMDLIRDFAFPLPAMVIATLLGVPTSDIEPIKRWSDRLAAYIGGSVDERDNFSEASAGVAGLVDYFRRLLKDKLARPSDDLVSLMLRAEHEGERLSQEEVVSNCVLLLFAGHETTTNLLGNGIYHLLRHEAELEALVEAPERCAPAIEEMLRYDAPVPATTKVATRDMEWRGAELRAGEMVLPFLSSANRDPAQFPDPDRFALRRSPNRHVSFAFGIHFCLGAPLARLEGRLALETLLRRCRGLSLSDAAPRWKPMIFLRGLEALPIAWEDSRVA